MSKMNYNITNDKHVFYGRSVLQSIILLAVNEINGVIEVSNKDIKFDLFGDSVSVEVSVSVKYGHAAFDIAYRIQENIRSGVEVMTGYKVKNVDVYIKSVVLVEA